MLIQKLKNVIGAILIAASMTGCSLLIPDKPFPTTQDYNMASLSCLQIHHPTTTFYGKCMQDQIEPRIVEIKDRAAWKQLAIGLEVQLWLGLINAAINQAWWEGVATGAAYY